MSCTTNDLSKKGRRKKKARKKKEIIVIKEFGNLKQLKREKYRILVCVKKSNLVFSVFIKISLDIRNVGKKLP